MLISVFCTLCWLILCCLSYKKSNTSVKYIFVVAAGKTIFRAAKLDDRIAFLLQHLHSQYLKLISQGWSYSDTKQKVEEKLGEAIVIVVGASWLAYAASEVSILFIACVAAIITIVQLFQGATKQVKQKQRMMLLELPIILTRLTLLVEAGETVQQAVIRCMEGKEKSNHPLHQEWNQMIYTIKNGESFSQAIEAFAKRCGIQQISLLATFLLLNYRRGGEHFNASIHDLTRQLWETRKTLARQKGEEASSKLIFPTVAILFLTMVLIVIPAILMMQFM